jgi:threonine/homoserine/homoserine lactone efflux protein
MPPLLFLFGSAFVVGLSGAMMPGPVLTATIGETIKRGLVAGPLIVAGHAILEVLLIVALIAGLSRWLEQEIVIGVFGVAGGAILMLMGVHTALTAKAAVRKALAAEAGGDGALRGPVLAGILTSLSNPYWSVWWATVGLGYLTVAWEHGVAGVASFYSGHILSDLAWFSLVAFAVASGRRVCPPVVYRTVLVLCGVALVGLGVYFVKRGVGLLV